MKASNSAKCKAYRARIKEKGLHDACKQKDRDRKRNDRLQEKTKQHTNRQIALKKEKEKIRKQRYRMRKKIRCTMVSTPVGAGAVSASPAFKSAQAYGKATRRVRKVLPESEKKAKAVIKRLAESFEVEPGPSFKVSKRIASEKESLIETFYCRDDISRQAPGKKDVVLVKDDNGVKSKVQKRNLFMTVLEAYRLFFVQRTNR